MEKPNTKMQLPTYPLPKLHPLTIATNCDNFRSRLNRIVNAACSEGEGVSYPYGKLRCLRAGNIHFTPLRMQDLINNYNEKKRRENKE